MANEQDPHHSPTSVEELTALLAGAKNAHQPMWPGNVPSHAQALEILRGQLTLAMSLPSARKLQEKLTQPEREALRTDGMADTLRDALVARWRLAAANDLLPNAHGKVDQAALDTLLTETDANLAALRDELTPAPELALAIDRTLEALTTEAIELASNVKQASGQAAVAATPAPAPTHAPKKAAPAPAQPAFQPVEESGQQPGKKRSQLGASIALAVVLLAAGAYHAKSLMGSPNEQSNYAGAPPFTQVIATDSGILLVQWTRTGPTTPEQQAWLQGQQAKGMQLKELSPGRYVLTPASKVPASAPATAGNTTP
jgi:hypothetical protein